MTFTDTLDSPPEKSRRYKPSRASNLTTTGIPWVGSIPKHWQLKKLRWTISLSKNGSWGSEPDGINDIACVRVADFDRECFRVNGDVPTVRAVPPSDRRGRVLRRGDLLLEKSGGGELQPVGAVALFDSDQLAVCSNFLARISCADDCDSRFMCYLHAHLYSGRVNVRSIKQTTGIQNLDAYSYFSERIPIPPLTEQRFIVAFLDHETARIDRLIAGKTRLIDLLEEKRTSLISEALRVPANAPLISLKRLISFTTSGSRGWAEFYADEGDYFIQSGNLDGHLGLDFTEVQRIKPPMGAEAERTRLKRHDVLVCITGALTGNVAVVDDEPPPSYINQHLVILRPNAKKVVPRFLAYFLASPIGQSHFRSAQYGGTKQGLGFADIHPIPVPVLPVAEQTTHVERIDAAVNVMNRSKSAIFAVINRLREYRSALIAAAVTGKIDVRKLASEDDNIPGEA